MRAVKLATWLKPTLTARNKHRPQLYACIKLFRLVLLKWCRNSHAHVQICCTSTTIAGTVVVAGRPTGAATPYCEPKWRICSNWTQVAEDRDLWKRYSVVGSYLQLKYGYQIKLKNTSLFRFQTRFICAHQAHPEAGGCITVAWWVRSSPKASDIEERE